MGQRLKDGTQTKSMLDEPKSQTAEAETPADEALEEVEETAAPSPEAAVEETDEADEKQSAPESDSAHEKLDNIIVRVDFRIGEVSMPVNELARLAPGFTLSDLPGLTFPRAQAISAGRVFAEGELVDIDGKIGFRITRLLS